MVYINLNNQNFNIEILRIMSTLTKTKEDLMADTVPIGGLIVTGR